MRSLRTYVTTMAVLVMCSSVVSANDAVIAQQIAGKLRTQQRASQLQGFQIRVNVEDGNVWLKGEVANDAQRQLALNLARRVPGVNVVVNDLHIQPVRGETNSGQIPALLQNTAGPSADPWNGGVQPTAAMGVGRVPTARPMGRQMSAAAPIIPRPIAGSMVPRPIGASRAPQRVASLPGHVISDRAVGGPAMASGGGYGGGGYANDGSYAAGGNYGGGPTGQYGGTAGSYDSPNMPGYAWPSYASHPNYAAVTYPQQYSPAAWPYIGPFYPYPQVPLGWRKVALEWDDGWWFLDFSSK